MLWQSSIILSPLSRGFPYRVLGQIIQLSIKSSSFILSSRCKSQLRMLVLPSTTFHSHLKLHLIHFKQRSHRICLGYEPYVIFPALLHITSSQKGLFSCIVYVLTMSRCTKWNIDWATRSCQLEAQRHLRQTKNKHNPKRSINSRHGMW